MRRFTLALYSDRTNYDQPAGHGDSEAHNHVSVHKGISKMVRVPLFLATLLATIGSHASDTFLIKSELTHGGELLGSPAIAVDASVPATISVGDSYKLTFLTTPQESGTILIATDITVAAQVETIPHQYSYTLIS